MTADVTGPGTTGAEPLEPRAPVSPVSPVSIEDLGLFAPVEAPDQPALPLPPTPSVLATYDPATPTEQIICPECGTTAHVALTQRDARDFCVSCDYPLFWVPRRTVVGRGDADPGSLRRLPGTVGRATVASLECPHCDEPNVVTAEVCVRCGLALQVVAAPAAPVVVEPEPLPEPEPELGWTWWAWIVVVLAALTIVGTLAYLVVTHG